MTTTTATTILIAVCADCGQTAFGGALSLTRRCADCARDAGECKSCGAPISAAALDIDGLCNGENGACLDRYYEDGAAGYGCQRCGGYGLELNPQTQMCGGCGNEVAAIERERRIRDESAHWGTHADPRKPMCARDGVKLIVSRFKSTGDTPMCAGCRDAEKTLQGADNLHWRNLLATGA